ncbi:Hypothetical protein NTJ_09095 [Nesidiocoris tenuis]|uniref:Vacuolar ATPase assembly protein VMA22 n=1 Tax=Nesidiocoris tenuis TaxID=355587 RepID=A0ABN7AZG0_9HEMI|nr:Hypothetical protein NTJ_09095 [Nesidiocoris tenuis]
MTKDSDYESVCRELDDLALQMLDQMKLYLDLLASMENSVKTGSLHLAKSRYIMGNKSVSVLQLPTEDSELSAQATLVTDKTERLTLKLANLNVSADESNAEASSEADGLKRRKDKGKPSEPEENQDAEESPKKKKDVMQDPLKWFGVLVPQNMRLAQLSFKTAVEIAVDLANVQLEMASIRKRYCSLLLKKKELRSGAV